MIEHYLDRLARTISENWDQPALTDFYLTEDGTAQDTTRGDKYTYGEMYLEMMRLGEMFRALGLKKGDHIAICGANSANWAVAYLAIAAYQGVAVTVLHTQAIEDIVRQIDFSDSIALFTDRNLWNELKGQLLPQIRHVIFLDDFSVLGAQESMPLAKIKESNRKHFCEKKPTGIMSNNKCLDDLATICFTSGSTGKPKGVMLPYRSFSLNIAAKCKVLSHYKQFGTHFCSFLPFGHIFGLVEDLLRVISGGLHCHILHINHSAQELFTCYKLVHPMYITMVPQLIAAVVGYADKYPQEQRKSVVKSMLGDVVKELIIGGAGLSMQQLQHIIDIGVPLSTCYGITECGPTIAFALSFEYKLGTSGIVLKEIKVRIAQNGEILVKGGNVMLGYYKDPEATARKIDKDGWLHTGDRGRLDKDNYLFVEGRLEQDIIVLPNGENIHPEDIESKINALPEVSESIVLARDGKLVALVVMEDKEQRTKNKELRLHILRTINPLLPLYSQIYDVDFLQEPLKRTEKQTIKRYLYN